jgi:multidrug efflux pump subunit AcrB
MPTTGAAGDLFAKVNDTTQIVQAKVTDTVQDTYPTVYYATIVAFLALLSAGATKIVTSGLLF